MPRIITTLTELRQSSRMCPGGWSKLLKGVGKTAADDEPLDALTCLSVCGPLPVLWHLRNRPDLEMDCRALALAFARDVAILSDDPYVPPFLNHFDEYLGGVATWAELVEISPRYGRFMAEREWREDGEWLAYDCERAATIAATLTTLANGCDAPLAVARFATQADAEARAYRGKCWPDSYAGHPPIPLRQAETLREFLSGG